VGDLDGQRHASDFHVFLAPVKLAGVTGRKDERDEGFFDRRPHLCRLPLFYEALNAVVGAAIALGLQTFKESLGGAPLRLGKMALGGQPAGSATFFL
jgi:hypothetical protein